MRVYVTRGNVEGGDEARLNTLPPPLSVPNNGQLSSNGDNIPKYILDRNHNYHVIHSIESPDKAQPIISASRV